ncbi:MAG: 50S ribosomal protein L6 [Sulfolobales archaeon]|nr:50S ribosomal protein L6 [Sulfolobales archaeon]MDW8083190.1 50S ribosomal protein L6 [Sulfolobales archaeon]
MARIVRLREEVPIPGGVDIEIEGRKIRVRGPKGVVERDFSYAREITIAKEGVSIILETHFADKKLKAQFYSVVSHIKNAIDGVMRGYRYKLKIVYSHFPISVKVDDNKVVIENFIGEKAPRVARIVGNVKVSIGKTDVTIEGCDLEAVSQTAANIEQATRIRELDRRVFVDGIYIYERGYAD